MFPELEASGINGMEKTVRKIRLTQFIPSFYFIFIDQIISNMGNGAKVLIIPAGSKVLTIVI